MIKQIACRFVRWQVEKSILAEQDAAVYQYGYELLLNQAVNLVISLVVALLLHSVAAAAVFLISYIPLRTYAGGYHASNNERCTVVSTFILIGVCLLVKAVPPAWYLLLIVVNLIAADLFIERVAPVEDRNKPLDELEVRVYHKRTLVVLSLEFLVAAFFCFTPFPMVGYVISVGHVVLAVTLLIGMLKNRYNRVSGGVA